MKLRKIGSDTTIYVPVILAYLTAIVGIGLSFWRGGVEDVASFQTGLAVLLLTIAIISMFVVSLQLGSFNLPSVRSHK